MPTDIGKNLLVTQYVYLQWLNRASYCKGRFGLENIILDFAWLSWLFVTLYQLLGLCAVRVQIAIKVNDETGDAVRLELFRYLVLNVSRVTWLHD